MASPAQIHNSGAREVYFFEAENGFKRQDASRIRDGFLHFGLHKTDTGWIFREWAPNATRMFLVGDFSDWKEREEFSLSRNKNGEWSVNLPEYSLRHGQKYKLRVYWPGGDGWRLPSYSNYVVQDENSVDFSAVVWSPKTPYNWQYKTPPKPKVPLIYERTLA